MKIYLAGPLFTASELAFNRELRDLLERAGHEVWLPQEQNAAIPRAAESIFYHLVARLESIEVVLANMDGADPDSGTCWDCGFAWAIGKPVVVFRTDVRSERNTDLGPYNLMMWAAATARLDGPFATVPELSVALLKVLDRGNLMKELEARRVKRVAGAW